MFLPELYMAYPVKLTHVSGNACVSGCSDVSGNACVSRCIMHTLTTDGPKKEVQLVVDVAVRAPPVELQQAPLIMVSGCAWKLGVYHSNLAVYLLLLST